MKRVEGESHLYRNDSGAIVNTDTDGYNNYIRMRDERQKEKMEIQEMKKDIGEIKSLLMEILNGSK
jgi:hypothetical protein